MSSAFPPGEGAERAVGTSSSFPGPWLVGMVGSASPAALVGLRERLGRRGCIDLGDAERCFSQWSP